MQHSIFYKREHRYRHLHNPNSPSFCYRRKAKLAACSEHVFGIEFLLQLSTDLFCVWKIGTFFACAYIGEQRHLGAWRRALRHVGCVWRDVLHRFDTQPHRHQRRQVTNQPFAIPMSVTVADLQGGPKNKPLPNYQKNCQIVLKSANEIRFIRQINVSITRSKYCLCDLLFDVNNYVWPAN